jgi:hypothetical protein
LAAFPEQVRGDIGHGLHEVQCGGAPISAKAPKGFGGRAVLEIVEDFDATHSLAVMAATPPAGAGRAALDIVHTGAGFGQRKC